MKNGFCRITEKIHIWERDECISTTERLAIHWHYMGLLNSFFDWYDEPDDLSDFPSTKEIQLSSF